MHVEIDGKPYPAVGIEAVTLDVLMELRQQSRPYFEGGIGMRALKDLVSRHEGGETDEDDAVILMAVTAFLAKRASGEQVTFKEAVTLGLDSVRFVPDPGDEAPAEAGEPDPTRPTTPGTDET